MFEFVLKTPVVILVSDFVCESAGHGVLGFKQVVCLQCL